MYKITRNNIKISKNFTPTQQKIIASKIKNNETLSIYIGDKPIQCVDIQISPSTKINNKYLYESVDSLNKYSKLVVFIQKYKNIKLDCKVFNHD